MNSLEQFHAENAKLKEEWHRSYACCGDFIYDGPIDPSRWFEGKARILGILKEAHGGGTWDHAEAIRSDGGLLRVGGTANQATHNRMVEWLYAIETSLKQKPINVEADRINDYPEAKAIMLASAWINIKKANGVSQSDANELRGVAERDIRFLSRQVKLLSARIVLFCGTFQLVGDMLFPDCQKIPGTFFSYQSVGSPVLIDYRHPARAPRESYEPLIEEIERIRGSGMLLES